MSKFLGKHSYHSVPDAPKDIELIAGNVQHRSNDHDLNETTSFALKRDDIIVQNTATKRNMLPFFIFAGACALMALILVFSMSGSSKSLPSLSLSSSDAVFDSRNRYVMRNFDLTRPMSNFLNGLGGIWGIPMWAFYVNRGQGITSFGKQNKDNAIAKFVTAEKAYLQTPFTGFRTFVKGKRSGGDEFQSMPFFPRVANSDLQTAHLDRNMMIGLNEMEIEEINLDHKLQTNIVYYVAPDQEFPSLVRSTTFTNLDNDHDLEIEVLDGLGQLIPNGLGNYNVDAMGRTMEAWMNVYNVGLASRNGNIITEPFFHISQDTADTAQVRLIKDGYFALAYLEDKESTADRKLLPFVVDPSVVFGTDTTLSNPSNFFGSTSDINRLVSSPQGTTSRTPCSFAGAKIRIPAGQNATITSVYGYAPSLDTFVGQYAPLLRASTYSSSKRTAANELASGIVSVVDTNTSSAVFNAYVKQDFLDNILRGGLPIQLGEASEKKNFHVYSRIHGDIERDYNYFQIDTTYFSQGPGNFRDVCQNRRLDVLLSPSIGDFNLRMFLAFIQADGYNPLTVASTVFKMHYENIDDVILSLKVVDPEQTGKPAAVVKDVLRRTFRPGQFFRDVEALGVTFGIPKEEVVAKIISHSDQDFAGQFAQNGYWADHWTYILDLLDTYLAVFPDKEEEVLFDSEPIPFFVSPAIVKARSQRYSLVPDPSNPSQSVVRVYKPITTWGESDFSALKVNAMNTIFTDPHYLIDQNGAAGVWQRRRSDSSVFEVSAIAKFLMLGTLKFSTLDPFGMGVEMEGGKPGWNDAMNGLPGLLGSGMPETFEMLRILKYLRTVLQTKFSTRSVEVPVEFAQLLSSLETALNTFNSATDANTKDFQYWDATNTAREVYRSKIVATFSGDLETLSASALVSVLRKMESKTAQGIARALTTSSSGLTPTYFYYDMVEYGVDDSTSTSMVTAKKFEMRTLPLFLEGPTRHLKVVESVEDRRRVYNLVKNSPLYDSALKMYTLSESLAFMGQDIGRMKAFSAGWLENQSVWLHMSYKFYLELLRGGLYEEFFAEILTGLVPFMDNKVYGRSPLEAASFIVSSAFPDAKLHGASFLARLSGSTAEFLSMWSVMMAGPSPFIVDNQNRLQLALSPILPSWLFNEDGTVSFTFLGKVLVVYHNPAKANTWTLVVKKYSVILSDDSMVSFEGRSISSSIAEKVRSGDVKKIDVFF